LSIEVLIMTATILGAVTAILLFAIKIAKIIKKVVHFLDDFIGEEERPGQDARPGFSERLTNMEECMGSVKDQMEIIQEDVKAINKEMHPNSGSSIKDSLNRIEKRVNEVEEKIVDHVSK